MFKVGDIVLCTVDYDTAHIKGRIGKVVSTEKDMVGVEFPTPIGDGHGHSCGGTGKSGLCWNISKNCLVLAQKEWD